MRIKIAERLRPFSHLPGVQCLIPQTTVQVQVFPVLLRFKNLMRGDSQPIEYRLDLKGPFKNFTVIQDLENLRVRVFGHSADGYVRYCLFLDKGKISIDFEKYPKELPGRLIEFPIHESPQRDFKERLSLGENKAQDWDLVRRRQNLKEIFPIWFRLGQTLPDMDLPVSEEGTVSLLKECESIIENREKKHLMSSFLNLFNAGFEGILVPRLLDDQFQGLVDEREHPPLEASPLILLSKGSALIRSLFFKESGNDMFLLPCLPPDFDCGRFLHLQSIHGDVIDIEWSKKILRRFVLRSKSQRELNLHLQRAIKKFRLRRSPKDRGQVIESGQTISLKANETLFFDRFQK